MYMVKYDYDFLESETLKPAFSQEKIDELN